VKLPHAAKLAANDGKHLHRRDYEPTRAATQRR
jgi:hypothetical protein